METPTLEGVPQVLFAEAADSDGGGSDTSAEGAAKPVNSGEDQVSALSEAEFLRLQDELMAVKMCNQDLLEMRRLRLQNKAQIPPRAAAAPTTEAAAASTSTSAFSFGRSLYKKANKASMSFSTLTTNSRPATGGPVGVPPPPPPPPQPQQPLQPQPPSGPPQLQTPPPQRPPPPSLIDTSDADTVDDIAALRMVAESLRSRIRSTLEQVKQHEAVAGTSRSTEPILVPEASFIRERVADKGHEWAEEFELIGALGDPLLVNIASAALSLAGPTVKRRPTATSVSQPLAAGPLDGAPPSVTGAGNGEGDGDDDRALLQRKIGGQQEELDRLLEIYTKQKTDITRLRDEIQNGSSEKVESAKGKEAKQQAKDKLRETEQHIQGLTNQLQISQEASDQAQALRTQLHNAAERASQLGAVVGEMQSAITCQGGETALLRERLRTMQEDLGSLSVRRGFQRQKRLAAEIRAAEALADAQAVPASASSLVLDNFDAQLAAELAVARHRTSHSVDTAVQADLSADGLADRSDRTQLRMVIEDLRIEKALLQKRTARNLQELRNLVASPPDSVSPPVKAVPKSLTEPCADFASADADVGVGTDNPSSPSSLQSRAFLVDNQGLGATTPGLAFRSSASLADLDSENALVKWGSTVHGTLIGDEWLRVGDRFLPVRIDGVRVLRLQGVTPPSVEHHFICSDDEDAQSPRDGEETPPEPYPAGLLYVQRIDELEQCGEFLRTKLSDFNDRERSLRMELKEKNDLIAHLMKKSGSNLSDLSVEEAATGKDGNSFWRRGQQEGDAVEDLERVIEETTQENIRLRNDIQIMSEELRKVMADELPGPRRR